MYAEVWFDTQTSFHQIPRHISTRFLNKNGQGKAVYDVRPFSSLSKLNQNSTTRKNNMSYPLAGR